MLDEEVKGQKEGDAAQQKSDGAPERHFVFGSVLFGPFDKVGV